MTQRARGLGRIYRRGEVWWIQYGYRGQDRRESTHSAVHADAVKLLNRRRAEIGTGRLIGPDAERVTFADLAAGLLNDYRVNGRRSLRRAQNSVDHLRAFFGADARALDITTERADAYIVQRQAEGAASATIQNELAALKRMLTLAVDRRQLPARPKIPRLHIDNARQGFFEAPELAALLAELPDTVRPVIEFAHLTGWRIPSEVLPLMWRQVDFHAGVVRLEPGTTKNREGRTFPFAALPALEAVLRRQRDYTSAVERRLGQLIPWVFHREGRPIRVFRNAWERACARGATLKGPDGKPAERDGKVVIILPALLGRIPHDLRRTAVRNLERAGVPRSVAMKLTGHKTESVYNRYAIVAEQDLREGVAKLALLHPGGSRTVLPFESRTITVQSAGK